MSALVILGGQTQESHLPNSLLLFAESLFHLGVSVGVFSGNMMIFIGKIRRQATLFSLTVRSWVQRSTRIVFAVLLHLLLQLLILPFRFNVFPLLQFYRLFPHPLNGHSYPF